MASGQWLAVYILNSLFFFVGKHHRVTADRRDARTVSMEKTGLEPGQGNDRDVAVITTKNAEPEKTNGGVYWVWVMGTVVVLFLIGCYMMITYDGSSSKEKQLDASLEESSELLKRTTEYGAS